MRVKSGSRQSNIFDILGHAQRMSSKKSGLDRLNRIDWEAFRPTLIEHLNYCDQAKGGRPPWCPILMLKVIILQRFHNLSDVETEFQINDRFSFLRFVGLRPGDAVPDHSTIWDFKERLGEEGVQAIFEDFNEVLKAKGLVGNSGKIVDASFVDAPRQRNSREENAEIKAGKRPESFDQNPRRGCQKDSDARWAKKNDETHYGYKNHLKVDAVSKFIEEFILTNAAVHDSQAVWDLIGERDRGSSFWADSAYTGQPIQQHLDRHGVEDFACAKGYRDRRLSEFEQKQNRIKSSIRARVEHVFGRIAQFGGDTFRRIGKKRATFEGCLTNLTYNLDRYAMIHR